MKVENNNIGLYNTNFKQERQEGDKFANLLADQQRKLSGSVDKVEVLDNVNRMRDEKLYNSLMSNYVTSIINAKYTAKGEA